jgi:hypothetical protein
LGRPSKRFFVKVQGEPTEEEAFEKAIIEKNIFQIKPKSGTLKPGDFKDIELIYNPGNIEDESDTRVKKERKISEGHILKVVLQILNGKPLVINLKGTTLAPLEGLLAMKKNKYILPSTPIGLLVPVKFPLEIQNVGSGKISYKVEICEILGDQVLTVKPSGNKNLDIFGV